MKPRLLMIVIILTLFLGGNFFTQKYLNLGLDLSFGQNHTLSQSSKKIIEKIDKKTQIKFYYSFSRAKNFDDIFIKARQVKAILQEIESASNGKIDFEIINPIPFTLAEKEAIDSGIPALSNGAQNSAKIYFGMGFVGNNQTRIANLTEISNQDLENEIIRKIYFAAQNTRKKIGIINSYDWFISKIGDGAPMIAGQEISKTLAENYELLDLNSDFHEIPHDISALILIQPQLSVMQAGLIEKFVNSDGQIFLAEDIFSTIEYDNFQKTQSFDENTKILAQNLGIGVNSIFALDLENAISTNFSIADTKITGPQPLYFTLSQNKNTSGVNFLSACEIQDLKIKNSKFEAIFQTSKQSDDLLAASLANMPTPDIILSDFKAKGENKTIAAKITNSHNGKIIFVCDTDFLADIAYISDGQVIADNLNFAANAIYELAGDEEIAKLEQKNTKDTKLSTITEIRKQSALNLIHNLAAQKSKLDMASAIDKAQITKELQNLITQETREISNIRNRLALVFGIILPLMILIFPILRKFLRKNAPNKQI